MKICMGCMGQLQDNQTQCPVCGYTRGTPAKEAYHMVPETIIHGKYILGRVLGYGGFGVTYLGWDARLERKVAIKEYMPSDLSIRMPGETMLTVYHGEAADQFEVGLQRFIEEAQRLAKFNQLEGVVDIYDTFIENNTGYIVMQFLEGITVKEIIKANGALPFDTAQEIVVNVLATLKEVHKEGIIHRDLSPDNIFITTNNEVKLLDFGAARYAAIFHSKSLSVILKPGYAPEEQYRSRGNQGPWSDIYALAATFYRMVTGITPEEAMERAINDTVQPPSKLGVEIPVSTENAIMNAMNVRIEERTKSAQEFIDDLASDDVKRVEPVRRKQDVGKIPAWLKIASVTVGALLITLVGLLAVGSIRNPLGNPLGDAKFVAENQVNTPGVINLFQSDADAQLTTAGLHLQVQDRQFSDKVDENKIMQQEPLSGRLVDDGVSVYVVISSGSEAEFIQEQKKAEVKGKVSVPNLTGMREANAIATLQRVGLKCSISSRKQHSVITTGSVVSQSIASETLVQPGTTVEIIVSLGSTGANVNASPQVASKKTAPSESVVKKVAPTGIVLDEVNMTLDLNGNTVKDLSAVITPENVNDTSVIWSSNNESIATVSSNGTITAYSEGKAIITAATENGKNASCVVTVMNSYIEPPIEASPQANEPPQEPIAISLEPGSITLKLDPDDIAPSRALVASIFPGNTLDQSISWSSANGTIATVNAGGVVTGHSVGRTTITVTTVNGLQTKCEVTVE